VTDVNDIIDKWLSDVQKDLILNYDKLGLRASGKWANSLEGFQEKSQTKFRIGVLGENYTFFLENGRGKTKATSAGSPTLREIIREWIDIKGITPYGDISKDSLAYLIARKIHEKGIQVPNKWNKGGLVSNVVTIEKINELNKSLTLYYISDFRSKVVASLKLF
jgi:hypothetical protein